MESVNSNVEEVGRLPTGEYSRELMKKKPKFGEGPGSVFEYDKSFEGIDKLFTASRNVQSRHDRSRKKRLDGSNQITVPLAEGSTQIFQPGVSNTQKTRKLFQQQSKEYRRKDFVLEKCREAVIDKTITTHDLRMFIHSTLPDEIPDKKKEVFNSIKDALNDNIISVEDLEEILTSCNQNTSCAISGGKRKKRRTRKNKFKLNRK